MPPLPPPFKDQGGQYPVMHPRSGVPFGGHNVQVRGGPQPPSAGPGYGGLRRTSIMTKGFILLL